MVAGVRVAFGTIHEMIRQPSTMDLKEAYFNLEFGYHTPVHPLQNQLLLSLTLV
jgi:hypothetical protein